MGDPFKNFQPICKTCKRYNQLNQISIFTLINTYIIIPIDTYLNIFHFSNIQPSQSAPTVSLKNRFTISFNDDQYSKKSTSRFQGAENAVKTLPVLSDAQRHW